MFIRQDFLLNLANWEEEVADISSSLDQAILDRKARSQSKLLGELQRITTL